MKKVFARVAGSLPYKPVIAVSARGKARLPVMELVVRFGKP